MPGGSETVSAISPLQALLLSAAALAAVCGEGFWRRRFRQTVWIKSPEQLLNDPRGANVAATLGGLCGIAAGVAWMPTMQTSAWSPIGLALAGLAILGWGHFFGSAGIGFAGLLAVGAAVAAIPTAWFGAATVGPLVGWVLAACWMLWLAKFWDQQLDEGRAWTTTGALIPIARGAALAFAMALLRQAFDFAFVLTPGTTIFQKTVILLSLLFLMIAFLRSAQRQGSYASTLGFWVAGWSLFFVTFGSMDYLIPFLCLFSAILVSARVNPRLRTPRDTMFVHWVVFWFLIPSVVGAMLFLQTGSPNVAQSVSLLVLGIVLSIWPRYENLPSRGPDNVRLKEPGNAS